MKLVTNLGGFMAKNSDRKVIDKVFILLGAMSTVVLLVVGGLALYGYSFATNMVTKELSEQKVYFPAAGSEALASLPKADRDEVSRYAGQQLVNGEQARVYADHFIGVHLGKIAGGKTYAEVSSEAMADPTNAELQAQKATLFQGETLRGMLLGMGYSFWTFGMIALYAAWAAFAGAVVMAVLVLLGLCHLAKLK